MIFIMLFPGCENSDEKVVYEEVRISSPLEHMPNNPHEMGDMRADDMAQILQQKSPQVPLVWDTPEGWKEERGSGLRLATFSAGAGENRIECSIVSLGGQAGGMEANIERWIRQIDPHATVENELMEKILDKNETFRTQNDFPVALVDLTDFKNPDNGSSMIAAIIDLPDMAIFVKMTGQLQALIDNKTHLRSLAASIRLQQE